MSDQFSSEEKTQILDFSKFKKKKDTESTFARGRKPLYVSHLSGKVSGNEKGESEDNFGDRLERIKSSLERINSLMSELKKMSKSSNQPHV